MKKLEILNMIFIIKKLIQKKNIIIGLIQIKKLYPDKIIKSIAYDENTSINLFNTFILIFFLKKLKDLIKQI